MKTNFCSQLIKGSLLVLAAVLISGCVGRDVRTDSNSGLSMNKFFADPERVDSGDIFRVYMEVENVGGRTARSVRLDLIATAFEQQELQATGIAKIGQPLPEFTFTTTERKSYYFTSLAPPQPELNQPGEFRVVSWPLQAPFVPEGVVKDFRLLGSIRYDYSTSASVNIPVYTRNEFRQAKELKSFETASTNGPLKISVSGPSQIVVNTDPDIMRLSNNEMAVYTITIKNTGDGIPFTANINGLVKGSIRFTGGITPVDCLRDKTQSPQAVLVSPSQQAFRTLQPGQSGEAYRIDLPENENGLVLRNGDSVTFSCTLALARDQWISRPFGTATVAFDLTYLYFVEKEATVAVRGPRI